MRVFLIVLDSVGIGELPDAIRFGDQGSNTLKSCFESQKLYMPVMKKLGFFNIDGLDYCESEKNPKGAFARLYEKSCGKDTTVGHWEIAGIISNESFPTYPNGFPQNIIEEFERKTRRKILCNKPYSGTDVIRDYGERHLQTGELIVYTSADSVFQIAAHESKVKIEELYNYCEIARGILVGEHAVGRVIARPFIGENKHNFTRTSNRRDLSVTPPCDTMLDIIKNSGKEVIGIGKIGDIFGGKGLSEKIKTKSDNDGMDKLVGVMDRDFEGLCFVNLVDFDAVYGHRNNVLGYTENLNLFDKRLGEVLEKMTDEDILMITADHGCDPKTPSTDHSREATPLVIYGKNVKSGVNLGTRESFADIAKTVCDLLKLENNLSGKSFKNEII